VLAFGITGCTSEQKDECYYLSAFTIRDFKITPHVSDPTRSTFISQLINNRGTNVTVWDVKFESSSYHDIVLGEGENPQIYVWNCSPESCDLVTTSYPFTMKPGQKLVVNGTIRIPSDQNFDDFKLAITYETPRLLQNHTDTGTLKCLVR